MQLLQNIGITLVERSKYDETFFKKIIAIHEATQTSKIKLEIQQNINDDFAEYLNMLIIKSRDEFNNNYNQDVESFFKKCVDLYERFIAKSDEYYEKLFELKDNLVEVLIQKGKKVEACEVIQKTLPLIHAISKSADSKNLINENKSFFRYQIKFEMHLNYLKIYIETKEEKHSRIILGYEPILQNPNRNAD